jgi:hypothetical protein
MALNFPDSPTLNQIYTDTTSGFSYQWNGTVWISFTPASTRNIKTLDDISGSFNGSTQTFALTSASGPITPANSQSVIINLGGVVQDPSDDYIVSGSNITFSTPPAAGLTFSGVVLGVSFSGGVGDTYYRQVYSPTGVQTSFSFVNGYTAGYLDVYRNGAKLVPIADYTATDGVNFSLITPAQAGDDIEAVGYKVTSVKIVDGSLNSLTVSGITTIVGATNLNSTLNVTGVSSLGTVRIASGIVTASSGIVTYYGDGSNLTGLSGIGTEVTGASGFSYIDKSGKVVTSNIVFDNTNSGSSNSYILLKENQLTIETGFGVTIGTGKQLIIDALNLP